MPLPLPRLRTVVLVAGAALLAKRALHRRIQNSPLWPLLRPGGTGLRPLRATDHGHPCGC